jgi:hypothetical protein
MVTIDRPGSIIDQIYVIISGKKHYLTENSDSELIDLAIEELSRAPKTNLVEQALVRLMSYKKV